MLLHESEHMELHFVDRGGERRFAAATALDLAHPTWRWVQGRADAMACLDELRQERADPGSGSS